MKLRLIVLCVLLAWTLQAVHGGVSESSGVVKRMRGQIERALSVADISYAESFGVLRQLSADLHAAIDSGTVDSTSVNRELKDTGIYHVTSLSEFDHFLLPRIHAASVADTNLIVAAGLMAQCCGYYDDCLAEPIFEACRTKRFDLVLEIISSLDEGFSIANALIGIDSLSPADRSELGTWKYRHQGSRSDPPAPSGGVHQLVVDPSQVDSLLKLIVRTRDSDKYAEAMALTMQVGLALGQVATARQILSELIPMEANLVDRWTDAYDSCRQMESSPFDASLRRRELLRYYGWLAFGYQKLGQKADLANVLRRALLFIDADTLMSAIPDPRREWFELAVDAGVYEAIEDLAHKMCYADHCQELLACQEADSGRFNASLERCLRLPYGFNRSEGLEYLADKVAASGNPAGARELLLMSLDSRLFEPPGKCEVYGKGTDFDLWFTATALARNRLYSDAVGLALSVSSASLRGMILFDIARHYRDHGNPQQYQVYGNMALEVLKSLPDSLRFYESGDCLRHLLIERGRLEEAEQIASSAYEQPEKLALAYARKGDFTSVGRMTKRIDNAYGNAQLFANCVDSALADGNEALALEFLHMAESLVDFGEFDGELLDDRDEVLRLIAQAGKLQDTKSLKRFIEVNHSPAYRLIVYKILAQVGWQNNNEEGAARYVDAAFRECGKALATESIYWEETLRSSVVELLMLDYRVRGVEHSLRKIREWSEDRNLSPICCDFLINLNREITHSDYSLATSDRAALHDLIKRYYGSGFVR